MDLSDKNYILIIVGILAMVTEILLGVATGFDLFIIGGICILSGGVGKLLNSFEISMVMVTVLSFIYITVGRSFVKNKLAVVTKQTNVDAIIGKKGMVIKKITSQKPGQVKVEGEIWRASADKNIEEGTEVMIESVSGVTLRVK